MKKINYNYYNNYDNYNNNNNKNYEYDKFTSSFSNYDNNNNDSSKQSIKEDIKYSSNNNKLEKKIDIIINLKIIFKLRNI